MLHLCLRLCLANDKFQYASDEGDRAEDESYTHTGHAATRMAGRD
jgi:hypothetical protein